MSARAGHRKREEGNERHLELNVILSSTNRRAGVYTEIVPTKRPEMVRMMSGMSECAR
jgi:hypothetical protein